MKDALGNEIKRGDTLVASDAYMEYLRKEHPAVRNPGLTDNFVVAKIKHGPFWDPNAKGYHEGGFIGDSAFDKDGISFRSWQVKKVAKNGG